MALQQNVSTRVSYKAHTATTITAGTLLTLTSDPGITGGQELRRVSSTLQTMTDTYSSNEVASHRQVKDMRHGPYRVQGDIQGELSPGTYVDLIEAGLRCTKVATFSHSQSSFTSIACSANTLTVGGSTWAAKDFRVGDLIRLAGLSDTDNNKDYMIIALSGTAATVTPSPDTMTVDTSFTVDRLGNKMFIPSSSFVNKLFLFEHYHEDVDVAQTFQECKITKLGFSMPASGLATCTIGVLGRDETVYTAANSPFLTGPTAVTTTGLTAAANGKIVVGGSVVGVVTGIDINHEMAAEAVIVAGQNFPADIMLGRSVVTGSVRVMFTDATFLNYYLGETEVEIGAWLTTDSDGTSPSMGFFMPRCKFTGNSLPAQGEAGIEQDMPFQALLKTAATGYDATTLSIISNTA